VHATHDEHPGSSNGKPRWSAPVEPHPATVAGELDVTRGADVVPTPTPAAPEQRRREPVHVEQPIEEDDPSRPVRKGWWQRRFTGA